MFARWLSKNGQLLGVLTVAGTALQRLTGGRGEGGLCRIAVQLLPQAECLLAEALQQYTQQNGQLALRELNHQVAGLKAGAIIETLSPSILTSLVLTAPFYRLESSLHSHQMSAFSRLQSLQLPWWLCAEAVEQLIPAFSALVDLRTLKVASWGIPANVIATLVLQLPGSLERLDFGLRSADPLSLQLQHLTALRSLHVGQISKDSKLPQQLNELHCMGCPSMQPLVCCMQLKSLEIRGCDTPDLSRFSSFAVMTRLVFSSFRKTSIDSLAATFSKAPMNSGLLELSFTSHEFGPVWTPGVATNLLQQLQWLGGLTSLSLTVRPDTPTPLAASLQRLAGLEQLHLHLCTRHTSQSPHLAGWSPGDMRVLTEVIADLPRLTDLALCSTGLAVEAIEPLARLTQLTTLTIFSPGFEDSALVKLVVALTELRSLDISCNDGITDPAILVISQTLQRLTCLSLIACMKVTPSAVLQLTRLQQLRHLCCTKHWSTLGVPAVTDEAVRALLRDIEVRRSCGVDVAQPEVTSLEALRLRHGLG